LTVTAKYRERYAERDIAFYADSITSTYTHALIVPAFNELPDTLLNNLTIFQPQEALFIVVANCPDNAHEQDIHNTRRFAASINAHQFPNVCVVDRISEPLPKRQGVGLARKIGTDLALELYARGQIESPWLYTTDADAILPNNYLHIALPDQGAVVFGHVHESEDARLQRAADLYDLHMAYYIAGLTYAGSTYAFPTLGSTIAVHAANYAQVRGYPRRNAAEDFYLLNKIAKVAEVKYEPKVVLTLAARTSERVPFGTGPALENITKALEEHPSGRSVKSYSFRSFELLRGCIKALSTFAEKGSADLDIKTRSLFAQLDWLETLEGFESAYAPPRRKRALTEWFDGLKTLRFIHAARKFYPDESLLNTLNSSDPPIKKVIASHMLRDNDYL